MSHHSPSWLVETTEGVMVRLHVQPKASRSEVCGEHGEGESARLKIRVAAPPVDGAANEEVIRFLAKLLDIPRSSVHIVRGASSRAKDVLLSRMAIDAVVNRLVLGSR